MANKKTTTKEHWLPQSSHLNQFALDGVIQVYRFDEGDRVNFVKTANHFPSSTSGIGFENRLYERPDLPVNTVEDNLAQIEGNFGKVLENKIKLHKTLTSNERAIVASYVGLLQHRTPRQREHLHKTMEQLDLMGKQMALVHGKPRASDRHSAEIHAYKQLIFTDTMAIAQDVGIWEQLDFCFMVVPEYIKETEFITGDNPVSLTDFTQAGLNSIYGSHPWHKTAESVVPLTPTIALFGNRVGIVGYKEVDYNYIREVNNRTLMNSSQMIISRTPLTERENEAIAKRFPQSLLLRLLDLPDGKADEEVKARESK